MSTGRYLRKCFGFNWRTGRKVGERHRWEGEWGRGQCIWCHRWLSQLWLKDAPTAAPGSDQHLANALRTGE